MYNAIRKIHLYSGLVVLVFLMMYFVSGYVMIHRPWFGGQQGKPPIQTRTETLAGYEGERTVEGLAAFVAERYGVRGRVNFPAANRQQVDAIRFTVFKPGSNTQVEAKHDGQTVTMRTNRENLAGLFVHLHRIHGYGGGWLFNTYVVFNDLASFSCIHFALSGVYLWWKTAKRKAWGVACLMASCVYGVAMVVYLLNAR